ncbi:hypothetical protein [Bacillus mycoides]|uniref:hypothetical protein n=1 Tax=Bacillus mycoides TaxID=1405 RepID=UPI000863E6BC|nr:hypothetical protein [Bacillus mycoides]OHX31119.1 hypothetical protein BWGOE5_29410 [Bacillus mycoides]SCM87547.1 Uncharacterized protein BWAI21_02985 [Bacillus mycoides]
MTVVGILGMVHDEDWQEKYQFPLSLVKELILEFKPDVICGEVHPDSWELYLQEGNPRGIYEETQNEYPNLIFPLCEEYTIKFVPINWFEFDVFKGRFDNVPIETRKQLESQLLKLTEEQLSSFDKGTIPFNSVEYDQITKEKYEWLHRVNPDVENINWNARHYIMIARVKNAIEQYNGKRILCIHGADHNYWYYESLKNIKNVEVIYPLR